MKWIYIFVVFGFLGFQLMLPPANIDSNKPPFRPSPQIIKKYNLPEYSTWTGWLNCRIRNNKLEELCDPIEVRSYALQMIKKENAGSLNLGQVCDIYDYFVRNWTDVQDPLNEEYFAPAEVSVTLMKGDCDDIALAMSTCLRAIGACTKFNAAYNNTSGHAYALLCLGQTDIEEVHDYLRWRYDLHANQKLYLTTDKWGNHWLNLDQSKPYPGCSLYTAITTYSFVLGRPDLCQ